MKRQLDVDLAAIRIEFASDGAASVMLPAAVYVIVRIVARLLTIFVPMSAALTFLTTIVWLVAALYVFVVVTWLRDDNWLAAGMLIGATFLLGGLAAELFALAMAPGSVGAATAVVSTAIQLLLRVLILVPLAGGFVAGARWLTSEIRHSAA